MSNRRFYFHWVMFFMALVIGGLSFWHSGFWMEDRKNVPNFTAIAMLILLISQGMAIREGLKERKT